jgi:hypothetical protein
MENWKDLNLSKEEEEGVVWEEEDTYGEDVFHRTLAGKLWTDSPFNIRAFKQTMIQAWRLKNHVEVEDLKKNLFLFRLPQRKMLIWFSKMGLGVSIGTYSSLIVYLVRSNQQIWK